MQVARLLKYPARMLSMSLPQTTAISTRPIRFLKRGDIVSLANVPPDRTLLEVLREDLGSTATKEGCGEGDCGACVVVLGEQVDGKLSFKAVNSCIRLAHSVDGMSVWTAEDIAADNGQLHAVQEAMLQCHGSQCGFCTPGFVMSLFAMYQNHSCKGQAISRELAQAELSGNLCRCTGYRPILDAAQMLDALPLQRLNEVEVLQKLEHIAQESSELRANLADKCGYQSPVTLQDLLELRSQQPGAQIVAGTTDVGLWVTKQHRQFDQIIDVTRVAELRRIEDYPHHIAIGAAVTLNDAFNALIKDRPLLRDFAARFAGLPVRNSGTLGGNVANGSPIGDSMPLLIALHARIVLASQRGQSEMALEDFYTGYRQNLLAPDEVLAFIKLPLPATVQGTQTLLRAYKISKRYDDDISAVCLALNLQLAGGVVQAVSIGAGGVAATPVRAVQTEAALLGQPWTEANVQAAMAILRAEFEPISDMRASSGYRREVLGNLLQRFWLESQGAQHINLESFKLEALA